MCRWRRNDGKRGRWWHLAAAAVSSSGFPRRCDNEGEPPNQRSRVTASPSPFVSSGVNTEHVSGAPFSVNESSGSGATGLGWREQLRDVFPPLFSTNTSTVWAGENGGAGSSHFARREELYDGA
nr:hypothetical protein Iba_chr04dCG14060 [Ipomoea batatas]GME19695.1 hypothetical protein Iba_scaffold23521CG0010 [Ipomoea batatas]